MHRDRHRAAALPAASVLFGSFRISVVSAWRPGGKAALTGSCAGAVGQVRAQVPGQGFRVVLPDRLVQPGLGEHD